MPLQDPLWPPSRAQPLWTWTSLMLFQVSQTRGEQRLAPRPTSACLQSRRGNGESTPEAQGLSPLLSFLLPCPLWPRSIHSPHVYVPCPPFQMCLLSTHYALQAGGQMSQNVSLWGFDSADVVTRADLYTDQPFPALRDSGTFALDTSPACTQ